MAKRFSLLLAAGALISAAALTPALADCVGDVTTSITCDTTTDTDGNGDTRVDSDGTAATDGNDVITVDAGARVEGENTAIRPEEGDDVVNIHGEIVGQSSGIRDESGDLTVNGDGTIRTTYIQGEGISAGGDVTITGDLTITNEAEESMGIRAGGDVLISGDVTIDSTFTGIYGYEDVTLSGDVDISAGVGYGVLGMFGDVEVTGDTNITVEDGTAILTTGSVTLDGETTVTANGETSTGIAFVDTLTIGEGVTVTADGSAAVSGMEDVFGEGVGNNQTVNNEGTINGDVLLNNGDDTFNALGGEVNGLIDGGEGTDTLTLDFDYTATSREEFRDLRRALRQASAASGTISFGGTTYNWVNFEEFNNLVNLMLSLPPGPVVVTVDTFIPLPRINGYDVAAPAAVFCVDQNSVAVYAIGADGTGNYQGQVRGEEIAAAVAAYAGSPVFLAGSDLAGLTLLDAETLLLTGPGYQFAFPVNTCG